MPKTKKKTSSRKAGKFVAAFVATLARAAQGEDITTETDPGLQRYGEDYISIANFPSLTPGFASMLPTEELVETYATDALSQLELQQVQEEAIDALGEQTSGPVEFALGMPPNTPTTAPELRAKTHSENCLIWEDYIKRVGTKGGIRALPPGETLGKAQESVIVPYVSKNPVFSPLQKGGAIVKRQGDSEFQHMPAPGMPVTLVVSDETIGEVKEQIRSRKPEGIYPKYATNAPPVIPYIQWKTEAKGLISERSSARLEKCNITFAYNEEQARNAQQQAKQQAEQREIKNTCKRDYFNKRKP